MSVPVCADCGWPAMAHEGGDCPDCPPPWSDPWETWHRALHLSGYHEDTAWYALGCHEGWIDPRTQLFLDGRVVTIVAAGREGSREEEAMRFAIEHSEYREDNDARPPCEGAVRGHFTRVDRRTTDDPAKIPAHAGEDPGWWYAAGSNHRIENGEIARDFDDEAWYLDVPDLDALLALHERFGYLEIHWHQANPSVRTITL